MLSGTLLQSVLALMLHYCFTAQFTKCSSSFLLCKSLYLVDLTQHSAPTGHTWILLATQVRRASERGPLYYRIQRPNNITAPDMQENMLLAVCLLGLQPPLCLA